jgi:hypothetical protein
MLSLFLSASLQAPRLELSTDLPHVGHPFAIRAVEADATVARQRVEVLAADGRHLLWLDTDGQGRAEWTASEAGPFTLRWQSPTGIAVLVPLHAVAPRRWWWMALWCVPLGAWLARAALRR